MNEIVLHPNVYTTGPSSGLRHLLERIWVHQHAPGDGTLFLISGFANYNGGVRFYETFKRHCQHGGQINAIFAGSTAQRTTSKQVVREMLGCGASVTIVNRKRMLHAKCYGMGDSDGETLIVTSGNFTGPGMSQNVEASALITPQTTQEMGFLWADMVHNIQAQDWMFYQPSLDDLASPAWSLLYDEEAKGRPLEETETVTMVLVLSHSDTARINAAPGTDAGRGTQYFWLTKDCYDFFPALTIPNQRGTRATYSCLITINFVDLGETHTGIRVTFEAENNLDFRLGTGPLRYSQLAEEGDIAAISRVGEDSYELRLYRKGTAEFEALAPYAVHYIGHQGKRYGYLANSLFAAEVGLRRVGSSRASRD